VIAPRLLRSSFEVPCTIEIEHTAKSLHAHVHLDGVEIEPGDSVTVHDAPTNVPFGGTTVFRSTATVTRGSVFDALWARFTGYRDVTELYEVGFEGKS
jgi:hypothetical protein